MSSEHRTWAVEDTRSTIPLEHQLRLCEQLASLARSGLAFERGLTALLDQWPQAIRKSAGELSQRLEQGVPLAQALAHDSRPSSRSLAATIQVGQVSNGLDRAIDSWVQLHQGHTSDLNRLRMAMIYPTALIIIGTAALGFTIYHAVPLYEMVYETTLLPIPRWFAGLRWIHQTLGWWLSAFAMGAFSLVWFLVNREKRFDRHGVPLSLPYRMRLRSHCHRMLGFLMAAERPGEEAWQLAYRASGVPESEKVDHFWEPIPDPTRSLLKAASERWINADEATQALWERAEVEQRQAEQSSERHAYRTATVLALAIGLLVIVTYIVLVYLPWIDILSQIGESGTRRSS